MYRYKIDIQLTIQGPFMSQSSTPGIYGVDIPLARNSKGQIVLPGSLVAGRLRQAWEELHNTLGKKQNLDVVPFTDEIIQLLGEASSTGGVLPQRKQLVFTDFICMDREPEKSNQMLHSRIALDQQRGAVKKGAVIVLESPFASGDTLRFNGSVRFDVSTKERAEKIEAALLCGLQWIPDFGAFSSIGFGRLKDVSVIRWEIDRYPVQIVSVNNDRFAIVLQPETPFCIAERPVAGNIFTSRNEIPGGVLKGALAETLRRIIEESSGNKNPGLQLLQDHFSKITFTHAFPAEQQTKQQLRRPVQLPLSLVKVKEEESLYDLALLDRPVLINGAVPQFQIDWKKGGSSEFGWPAEVKKEIRVHTAIDRASNRHQEGSLFSYEMVVPEQLCWLGWVDISQVDKNFRPEVIRQLTGLLTAGIQGLGKTKSFAACRIVDDREVIPVKSSLPLEQNSKEHTLILTMQSAALLLDYQNFIEETQQQKLSLKKAYARTWQQLSGNLLTLQRFFARQTLSGGKYQYNRFQQDEYRPWLLTSPGSVFVFSYQRDKAAEVKEQVQKWQRLGIPLADIVIKAYQLAKDRPLWMQCPFLPENGYGEIAVNLESHFSLRPKKSEQIEFIDPMEVSCE